MRKITALPMLVFMAMLALYITAGGILAHLLLKAIGRGDPGSALHIALAALLGHGFAIAGQRMFLRLFPLRPGEIAEGSPQEFTYQVYVLHILMLFEPVIRSALLPVPLMRPYYRALGAKLGDGTYPSGTLCDPSFVSIGRDSVIGQGALLVPHVIEGGRLGFYPIRIGDRVTIGAHCVILAGVVIEHDAMIASGAVIPKGAHIGVGETWGGVPARRLDIARAERLA